MIVDWHRFWVNWTIIRRWPRIDANLYDQESDAKLQFEKFWESWWIFRRVFVINDVTWEFLNILAWIYGILWGFWWHLTPNL